MSRQNPLCRACGRNRLSRRSASRVYGPNVGGTVIRRQGRYRGPRSGYHRSVIRLRGVLDYAAHTYTPDVDRTATKMKPRG